MTALAMQQMNQYNRQTNAGLKELKELSTVYKLVKRSNKVDQDLAIGLESQYPGIIRSRVAIGSFTDKPSERNVSITLEAVMETIKNAIKKIFESISNAIKKFKDWIMGIVNYFKKGEGSEPSVAEKAAKKDKNWSQQAIDLTNELLEEAFPKYKEQAKNKNLSDAELKKEMYEMVDKKTIFLSGTIRTISWAISNSFHADTEYDNRFTCYEAFFGKQKVLSFILDDLNKGISKIKNVEPDKLKDLALDDYAVDVWEYFNTTGMRAIVKYFSQSNEETKNNPINEATDVVDETNSTRLLVSSLAGATSELMNMKIFKKEDLTLEKIRSSDFPVWEICKNIEEFSKFREMVLEDSELVMKNLSMTEGEVKSLSEKAQKTDLTDEGLTVYRRLVKHYNDVLSIVKSFQSIMASIIQSTTHQSKNITSIHISRVSAAAQILRHLGLTDEMNKLNETALVKSSGKTIQELLPKQKKASTESDGVDYDDLSHDVSIQDEDDLAMALDAANEPSEAEYSDGI